MSVLGAPSRLRRKSVAFVVMLVFALGGALASVAQAKVVPAVPAAGVGTEAALNSPQCAPDGKLAYPYPQRLPCTAPLKKGASNGGATSMGVTKDKIRVVLFLGTHAQQDAERNRPGSSAPVDLGTNQPAYFEDSFPDFQQVLGHSFNLWNREFEWVTVNPTGTDEAAQRADVLNVASKEPFAVVVNVPVTAGGGQVFAAELVAKKIIVFFGGITNKEAGRQAPYRYLGGFDNNGAAVNTAIFAARQLQDETAKWSGDYVDKKRVFGTIHGDTGIDWEFFESFAKKEKLKVAENVVFTVPLDSSQASAKHQEEAPTLVAKLKDAGVTTVLLFTTFPMNQAVLKAADTLEYHPEWVFSGMGAQDIEITAHPEHRESRADEAHVRPRQPAALHRQHRGPPAGLVQLVLGRQPGHLLRRHVRHAPPAQRRRELRGAEAHARDVPAGDVQHAAAGRRREQAAAELHDGPRAHAGNAVRRVLPGRARLRHHVVEPGSHRQGQDHLRRRRRPVRVRRRGEALRLRREGRRVQDDRAQALRHEQLDLAVRRAPAVGPGGRLPLQGMPELES